MIISLYEGIDMPEVLKQADERISLRKEEEIRGARVREMYDNRFLVHKPEEAKKVNYSDWPTFSREEAEKIFEYAYHERDKENYDFNIPEDYKNVINPSAGDDGIDGYWGKELCEATGKSYIDHYVVERLRENKESRRAIVDFNTRNPIGFNRFPCLLAGHFVIRDNELNFRTFTRSAEIGWGLPTEMYIFMRLQKVVGEKIGVDLGFYSHYVICLNKYVEVDYDNY